MGFPVINFGILPITLKCEDDYDKISEGDEISIEGYRAAIEGGDELILKNKTTGAKIPLAISLTKRQREILLYGGTLNYTKAKA